MVELQKEIREPLSHQARLMKLSHRKLSHRVCLSSSVGGTHGLFDVRHSEDGWGVRAHVQIGGNQRRHGQAGRQVLRLPASSQSLAARYASTYGFSSNPCWLPSSQFDSMSSDWSYTPTSGCPFRRNGRQSKCGICLYHLLSAASPDTAAEFDTQRHCPAVLGALGAAV